MFNGEPFGFNDVSKLHPFADHDRERVEGEWLRLRRRRSGTLLGLSLN